MFAEERHNVILKMLYENKSVTVKELSKLFSVSMPTIRSDLEIVCALDPCIERTHGGIVMIDEKSKLTTYEERKLHNLEEKRQVAAVAASMIEHQNTILIDSSSTCFEIANFIEYTDKHVTVITTSLSVAMKLKENTNLTVVIIGGALKPASITVQNLFDDNIINAFNIDKYFFSASGISITSGFSDYNYNEVIDKKKFLSRSRQAIALIDSSKFNITSKSSFAQLTDVDHLITTNKVNEETIKEYKKEIDVILA